MSDPRLGDHATGIELQIEELVALRSWAERRGWTGKVQTLDSEIADLYVELATTAERLAGVRYPHAVIHGAQTAQHLVSAIP